MCYLSDEELEVASRFLFLSMALVVMRQDINTIETGSFKIKEPYLELLNKMTKEATFERSKLRSIMKKQDIKVVTLHQHDTFSSYLFICRGREERRKYVNQAIRKKVEAILKELMDKVQQPSQSSASANT